MRLSALLGAFLLASFAGAQVWEKPISPGLTYRMEMTSAPRMIHALRFTPSAPELKAVAELAGGTINEMGTVKGRLAPSKMAEANRAVAAINSDFFSFDHGAPIGLMVRNGELITSPFKARSVFGWGLSSQVGFPSFKASLADESGLNLPIDMLNQVVGQNQVALYTPAAGDVSISGENLMALIKLDGAVVRPDGLVTGTVDYLIADSRKMTVPADKALIVARGTKAPLLSGLRPGRTVRIKIETPGLDWKKVDQAVGGGPNLLRDNRILVDAAEQGFNAAFSDSRHPRTAVGRTKEGDLWFVAVDGRQSVSIGATLREMAEIMQGLGCTDAINLDGGGSTALHILGVTVNRPSDKAERPISSAVLFFAPPREVSEEELKIELPAKVVLGDQVELKVTAGGKPVPQSEVIWAMQGVGWIDQGGLVRTLVAGSAPVQCYVRGKVLSATIEVLPKAGEVPKAKGGKT